MNRWVVVGGAVLATGLILWAVLMLGSWGFEYRRTSLHVSRLQKMVSLEPTRAQVVQALRDEGMILRAEAGTAEELRSLARSWGSRRPGEVLAKGGAAARTVVFAGNDAVYVVYFDAAGVARDASYLSP